jgi:hypothetical protein
MFLRVFAASVALAVLPSAAAAQAWNTPDVDSLVARAIARRGSVQADTGLRTFRARAQGFVFFLGQLGEGFTEPPRLVKSDQLALEVYWQAPNLSKQIIIGRRDRTDLPTEVAYHRDHLGIVQNNFGDQIRFGDGDEVKDVPHPLSPAGRTLYNFALNDSLSIQLPDRIVRVYQVLVRPKDFNQALVVGSLFADVETAEVVRFRFSFTPPAYIDNTLEDITVELDNGLWFGQYWLPRRQEVEIRRRTSWLDMPARGIIRGRWEIGSYEFNVDLPPNLFGAAEPEIVFAPRAVRDTFPWQGTLAAAIDTAIGPVLDVDLDKVRAELTRAAASHAMTGLSKSRPGFGSVSDLVHVNRVEGLALGFGFLQRNPRRGSETGVWAGYGFADRRLKYKARFTNIFGLPLEARVGDYVRDVTDEPVISRLTNSFLAQEQGYDFADYYRVREAVITVGRRSAVSIRSISVGAERASDMRVNARPANGSYRLNPALGTSREYFVSRIDLAQRIGPGRIVFAGEAGTTTRRGSGYGRVLLSGDFARTVGPLRTKLSGWGGWGSEQLPPHRPFVLGGRGTLPGEGFRAWGGRRAALGRLDLSLPLPFPGIPLGSFGSTGGHARLGAFAAAGWAAGDVSGPWRPSGELRPVVGGVLEVFQELLRAELGYSLRDSRFGFSIDVQRTFWAIL